MAGFVVTAVFEVELGRVPPSTGVFARRWGYGYRFAYCDGRLFTLVVEVDVPDAAQAFERVLGRTELLWGDLAGDPLPAPSVLRVSAAAREEKPPSGAVGRGPDRVLAEAVAGRAADLRAAVAALVELQRPDRPEPR